MLDTPYTAKSLLTFTDDVTEYELSGDISYIIRR